MTVSAHTLTLAAGDGSALLPTSGSLTLDERWAPYVRASFEVAVPAWYATDPGLLSTRGGGILGAARVDYRDPVTAADVTAQLGAPVTPAKLSTVLGPLPLSALTAVLSAWGNPTERDAAVLPFDLMLTDAHPDPARGVLTLTACGYERRLQDYAQFGDGMSFAAGSSVRTVVLSVLGAVFPGLEGSPLTSLLPGPDALTGQAVFWGGGVTAWDFLATILGPSGLVLRYLPARQWQLAPAMAAGANVTLDRLTRLDAVESRDEWADVVLVAYNWTDPVGGAQVRADIATRGSGSGQRVKVIELRDTPYPGPGAAAPILARAQTLGRTVTAEAVADYSLAPGAQLTAAPPDRPAETGRVTAAVFAWPGNRMTLTATR